MNNIKFLYNRNTLFIVAMILGIFYGKPAEYLKDFAPYDLFIMMTASFSAVSFKSILSSKKIFKNSLIAILLNYILFGLILMGLSYYLITNNNEIVYGFLFIALAPPGVVIVPFSQKIKGNVEFSVIGTIIGYLLQIIIFPILLYITNISNIDIYEIIWQFSLMLILPLIFSRLIRFRKASSFLEKYRGRIVDITFFILIYIVIGLTSSVFFNNIIDIIIPIIIFVIIFFPINMLFYYSLKRYKFSDENIRSYLLMFSVKNNGVSALFSIIIIGNQAAIPSAALSVVLLLFLLVILKVFKHQLSNS